MSENVSEKKSVFTIKNILRVLAILCIIFVFCPAFLVSCSGSSQSRNISVMTAVGGISEYGEEIVEPHPIMIICLLLPIGILVLLFIKKFADRKSAAIILGCSAVDLVIWIIFRSSVKKIAEESYCSFKTTGWFVINIIVLILTILLTLIVMVGKMKMDADLIAIFSGGGTQDVLNQMSSTMSQMSNTVTQIAGNVAKSAETGAAKSASDERPKFCSQCGAKLEPDAAFCMFCGTKVK